MGIQYTYFPLYFKGLTAKRNVWLKCPYQGKSTVLPLQPLKRWQTQTLGALETNW